MHLHFRVEAEHCTRMYSGSSKDLQTKLDGVEPQSSPCEIQGEVTSELGPMGRWAGRESGWRGHGAGDLSNSPGAVGHCRRQMAHSSVVPYRGGGPGGRLAWQLAAWKERIMRHGYQLW